MGRGHLDRSRQPSSYRRRWRPPLKTEARRVDRAKTGCATESPERQHCTNLKWAWDAALSRSREERLAELKANRSKHVSQRLRILLVDDEPAVLNSLRRNLRNAYDVRTASCGADAIALLQKEGPFAVVVSDMQMPGMDGATFLSRARNLAPETVRLLLTGQATLEAALRAVNEGEVYRILTKPCPQELLMKTLSAAVDHHQLLTEDEGRLSRRLEEVSEQLVQAERLATLGTMAGAVGHELANITTILQALASMIRDRAEQGLPPEIQDLTDLERSMEHLKSHAVHLRHLGRPSRDEVTQLDLCHVVAEAAAMLKATGFTKAVSLRVTLPPRNVHVRMERTKLEQILVNLVKNSVDAITEDGRNGTTVEILVDVKDGLAHCTVRDDGPGIPPEHLESIWETYFTTKPADRGTGLGLPLVRQIIEDQDGTIDVSSTLGEGTAFTFQIPMVAVPQGQRLPGKAAENPALAKVPTP